MIYLANVIVIAILVTQAMKPKLLDLFCGAGGASMGYHQAGFEVVGVDIRPQPRYPFEFHQADALEFPLEGFDVIHASPPCQAYSVLRRANPDAVYPEMIVPVRQRLIETGKPYIMENVPGAPLNSVVVLCGSMFGLGAGKRQLRRHRLFESNLALLSPPCTHEGEAVGVYGHADGSYVYGNKSKKERGARRGAYQGTLAECKEAMGIDWMTHREMTQAIPPIYAKWLGEQILSTIKSKT